MMGRSWTSQPPGAVSIRLNVSPETRLKLSELAGAAGVPMSQFTRRMVEIVCRGKSISAQGIVEEMRKEKMIQFSSKSEPDQEVEVDTLPEPTKAAKPKPKKSR